MDPFQVCSLLTYVEGFWWVLFWGHGFSEIDITPAEQVEILCTIFVLKKMSCVVCFYFISSLLIKKK